MRLKSFHVRVFRNVIDSGLIEVTDNTCLVGKNEAGKSAIISALHRLNPAKPISLELLDEYPRWLKKQHEITGEIKNAVPITATFSLSKEEVCIVEASFGKGVLTKPEIVAKRMYAGEMTIDLPLHFAPFLSTFINENVSEILKTQLESVGTSSKAIIWNLTPD